MGEEHKEKHPWNKESHQSFDIVRSSIEYFRMSCQPAACTKENVSGTFTKHQTAPFFENRKRRKGMEPQKHIQKR